jgi:hypothetical protein
MDYLVLALVGLLLLGGLVALGLGHDRWNWGTVAAGLLVLLASGGYLYLVTRLAARERAWAKAITRYETDLARSRDALQPGGTDGRLVAIPDQLPLAALRNEHDRWRRAFERSRDWQGRVWPGASFTPPREPGGTGIVELPPDGNDAESPPFGVGSVVFLIDEADLDEGGRYLGQFRVASKEFRGNRHVLTVAETAARDGYDARVLAGEHPAVTVYENLPVDRWLAFYRTPGNRDAAAEGILPEAVKVDAETVAKTLESGDLPPAPGDGDAAVEGADRGAVNRLVEAFVETFSQHAETVPEDSWDDAVKKLAAGTVPPGTYWAEVEFTAPHEFAEGTDESKKSYVEGERAEFDLGTAVDLRDQLQKATIVGLVYRRPLVDAVTLLHGDRITANADTVAVDGAAALMRALRQEKADLDAAISRIDRTLGSVNETLAATTTVANELTTDLETWGRDVAAAERLTERFEAALSGTQEEYGGVKTRVVELGRELVRMNTTLTAEIDRVAPSPPRR